mmetsp:Transcript_65004/g.157254  ORF Transcript_65004/g.157254 Transcript_65004/m.157254 type:complete len:607 (+) Transcript_65004:3-1823(+)
MRHGPPLAPRSAGMMAVAGARQLRSRPAATAASVSMAGCQACVLSAGLAAAVALCCWARLGAPEARSWVGPQQALGCSHPRQAAFLRGPPLRGLRTASGCAGEGSGEKMVPADQDWREFRAKLVEREWQEGGGWSGRGYEREQKGWAHATPLVEQGSVLLSAPGDHFALQQQYFHKAVILIVRHSDKGDMGLILNRPTALSAGDLDLPAEDPLPDRLLKFLGLPASSANWNVWFGGDCYGVGSDKDELACSCLHTTEKLAADSEEVIRGVYTIDLARARELVASGVAERDEFLLLVGYCGWGPGQLQDELDRGGSWIMAAADQRALLGKLRTAQASLTSRLERARTREEMGHGKVSVADVGDGLPDWQRLVEALEPWAAANRVEGTAEAETQADDMLRRWIEQRLLPAPALPGMLPQLEAQAEFPLMPGGPMRAGMLLRGSATSWLLGAPPELLQENAWRMRPAQYLHKSVLLLLQDYDPELPCSLVVLDGPKIGTLSGGYGDVFFGGPMPTPPEAGGLLAVPGGGVWGRLELPPGLLELLLALRALEVAEGYGLQHAAAAPTDERWTAVGGTISTIRDALTAAQGDAQRKRWYRSYLGLDVDAAK